MFQPDRTELDRLDQPKAFWIRPSSKDQETARDANLPIEIVTEDVLVTFEGWLDALHRKYALELAWRRLAMQGRLLQGEGFKLFLDYDSASQTYATGTDSESVMAHTRLIVSRSRLVPTQLFRNNMAEILVEATAIITYHLPPFPNYHLSRLYH